MFLGSLAERRGCGFLCGARFALGAGMSRGSLRYSASPETHVRRVGQTTCCTIYLVLLTGRGEEQNFGGWRRVCGKGPIWVPEGCPFPLWQA